MAKLIPVDEHEDGIDNSYYQVRRAQSVIVSYKRFKTGELYAYYQRKNFHKMAERLSRKYFHKSKDLEMYQNVLKLYRIFLVLGPRIQRIKRGMKLDWSRGHLLSWVRSNCNRRKQRFYFSVNVEERLDDENLLKLNLQEVGAYDEALLPEIIRLFRIYYAGKGVASRLANAIFDPIMFSRKNYEYCVRVGNVFYGLEKIPKAYPNAVDLRIERGRFFDYQVKYEIKEESIKKSGKQQTKTVGWIDIFLSEAALKGFRDEVSDILKSSYNPAFKKNLIDQRTHAFIETAKFARSGFDQILEMKHWLSKKVSKLAATYPEINEVPHFLVDHWKAKKIDAMCFNKPNFFWDIRHIDEPQYMQCFSPYREPV